MHLRCTPRLYAVTPQGFEDHDYLLANNSLDFLPISQFGKF